MSEKMSEIAARIRKAAERQAEELMQQVKTAAHDAAAKALAEHGIAVHFASKRELFALMQAAANSILHSHIQPTQLSEVADALEARICARIVAAALEPEPKPEPQAGNVDVEA